MKQDQEYAIDYFSYGHPLIGLKSRISFRARKKIFHVFCDMIPLSPRNKVIDIGITPDQSLPESNYFERLYPYKDRITATSIEDAANIEEAFQGVKFIQTVPEEAFPFEDDSFDVLFCSAVLEHVGSSEQQTQFLVECLRIAKEVFITTPNRGFPIEMHTFLPFIHWLPDNVFRSVLRFFRKDFWADVKNLNLLDRKALENLLLALSKYFTFDYSIQFLKTAFFKSNILLYIKKKPEKDIHPDAQYDKR